MCHQIIFKNYENIGLPFSQHIIFTSVNDNRIFKKYKLRKLYQYNNIS